MEHILARDALFVLEVSNFDWHAFDLECQDIFVDEAGITMPLYLKLELIEIDTLEIKVVLPHNYSDFLRPQLHVILNARISDPMVLLRAATAAYTHTVVLLFNLI